MQRYEKFNIYTTFLKLYSGFLPKNTQGGPSGGTKRMSYACGAYNILPGQCPYAGNGTVRSETGQTQSDAIASSNELSRILSFRAVFSNRSVRTRALHLYLVQRCK